MTHILDWLKRWADIITGWSASLSSLSMWGMSPPTLILTAATIWWTLEKSRKERALRRESEVRSNFYLEASGQQLTTRRSLLAWLQGRPSRNTTTPGDLS